MTCPLCNGSGYVGGGNGNDGAARCSDDCMTDHERAMAGCLPRLSPDKLAAFDVACVRALRAIDAEAWATEPTLPGGHFGEVELTPVGAVPTVEI